jgi:hypothetical protein
MRQQRLELRPQPRNNVPGNRHTPLSDTTRQTGC